MDQREAEAIKKHYGMLQDAISDIVDYINCYDAFGWDMPELVGHIDSALDMGRRDINLLNPHGLEKSLQEIEDLGAIFEYKDETRPLGYYIANEGTERPIPFGWYRNADGRNLLCGPFSTKEAARDASIDPAKTFRVTRMITVPNSYATHL